MEPSIHYLLGYTSLRLSVTVMWWMFVGFTWLLSTPTCMVTAKLKRFPSRFDLLSLRSSYMWEDRLESQMILEPFGSWPGQMRYQGRMTHQYLLDMLGPYPFWVRAISILRLLKVDWWVPGHTTLGLAQQPYLIPQELAVLRAVGTAEPYTFPHPAYSPRLVGRQVCIVMAVTSFRLDAQQDKIAEVTPKDTQVRWIVQFAGLNLVNTKLFIKSREPQGPPVLVSCLHSFLLPQDLLRQSCPHLVFPTPAPEK